MGGEGADPPRGGRCQYKGTGKRLTAWPSCSGKLGEIPGHRRGGEEGREGYVASGQEERGGQREPLQR